MKLKALVLYVQLFFSTRMCMVREYKCFNSIKSSNEIPVVSGIILFSEEVWGSSAPSVSSPVPQRGHDLQCMFLSSLSYRKAGMAPHSHPLPAQGSWGLHHTEGFGHVLAEQGIYTALTSKFKGSDALPTIWGFLHGISEQELHCCEWLPGAVHLSPPIAQTTDGI